MQTRSNSLKRTALNGASLLGCLAILGHGAALAGDTITVTAQKREQRLQDVPIAVSAITGEALTKRGINDLTDIAGAVPGVSFSGALTGRQTFAIRGISTTTEIPTAEFYIDDIPVTSRTNAVTGASDPDVLDLARVEVLKGPQGTLYGGSAMGGAIKFVTNRPDTSAYSVDVGAEGSSTRYGDANYTFRGVVNAPLVEDRLALRLAAQYRKLGGFVDKIAGGTAQNFNQSQTDMGVAVGLDGSGNPLTVDASGFATSVPPRLTTSPNTDVEDDINSSERIALRASLLFSPDDSLTILPSFSYQNTQVDDTGYFWGNLPGLQTSSFSPETSDNVSKMYSLTVEKDFGGVTFTSLTSYRDRQQKFYSDGTFYLGGFFDSLATIPSWAYVDINFTVFTQELRLSSDNDSPLQWTVGGFYADEQNDTVFERVAPGSTDLGFGTATGFVDRLYYSTLSKGLKQYAGFGEATYSVTDAFDLTVGGRVFKIDQDLDRFIDGPFAGAASTFTDEVSETGFSPRVSAAFRATPDNLLYATVSKGFRAGGANNGVPETLCAASLADIGRTSSPNAYESDSLWNYEIGSKNSFADGRVTLNAAAYFIDWSQIQQEVFLPSCGFTFTTNVGKAESKGGELELQVVPFDGFTIGGGVTLTDSTITEAVPGTGAVVGDRVLKTPKWSLQTNAEYVHPMGGDLSLFLRGDYQYRTKQWRSFNESICRSAPGAAADATRPACTGANQVPVANTSQIQDAYGLANFAIGVQSEKWSLQVFVNNAFDSRPTIDHYQLDSLERWSTLRPRTIGVRAEASLY